MYIFDNSIYSSDTIVLVFGSYVLSYLVLGSGLLVISYWFFGWFEGRAVGL
jgi:hypothetical protein